MARPRSHRGGGVRVRVRWRSRARTRAEPRRARRRRRRASSPLPMISGDRDTTPAAAASTTTFRSAASSASMAAACSRCHPNRAEGFLRRRRRDAFVSNQSRADPSGAIPRAAARIATAAFVSRRSSAAGAARPRGASRGPRRPRTRQSAPRVRRSVVARDATWGRPAWIASVGSSSAIPVEGHEAAAGCEGREAPTR